MDKQNKSKTPFNNYLAYKAIWVFVLCTINTFAFSQETQKTDNSLHPFLKVESDTIAYDTIIQNSNTTKRIIVMNEGNLPLQIFSVRSSCGVSAPSWPRQPIEPGDKAFIQIRYDSSNLGPINRNLIIHSNSPESTKTISIKGYVVPDIEEK